jgi:hypothetical protein
MASGDKRRRGGPPSAPTNGQLLHELRTLRSSHEQLKATVRKLKDILQVQDNWHSRVSKWIKRDIELFDDREEESIRGVLLWTDRYNLGIEVDGGEEIFNKGHVVRIRLA